MQEYYKELIKFIPDPIQTVERNELKQFWQFDAYPCLEVFLDFYEYFQNAEDIRNAFLSILPIERIHIKNGGLVFAVGHKNNYPVGVECSDLVYEDPRVKYQIRENGTWYNECGSLKSFLFHSAAWHILQTMHHCIRFKARTEKVFEDMVGDSLFYIVKERNIARRSNYYTCQNAEKNILGIYNIFEGYVYLAASDSKALYDFADRFSIADKAPERWK